MDKILTLEEVAEFLRVHPTTVYRLLRKSKIPAFKVGSDWRFNEAAVGKWIKDLEVL
jgi:excisionase family DNA binding protein